MKKIGYYLLNIIAFVLFFASYWALDTYGNFSGDELFFHLLVPLGGINNQSLTNLLTHVFIPGIIFGILITILIIKFIKEKRIIINVILFFIITIYSFHNINIFTYVSDQINQSDFIKNYYVETKDIEVNFPKEKQNLIYIYLESMENTYSSKKYGGSQNKNLIPNLTQLALNNTSFSNNEKLGGALHLNGTAWTAAAMVGQTSGLPLKINTSSNGIIDLNNFFPNTKTLGDILKENGYKNYLLVGSDSNYGCRKQYFEQHGSYQIYDLNTAIKNKEMTTTLFRSYKDQYSNVINCADTKISKFIDWIKQQEFYKNTTIIIVGDHLSMDTDYFKDENYQRTIYNVILNSKVDTQNNKNREFSTLDMFPTAIASLGAEIKGNRLGLGTNLFSDRKTIIEEKGYSYVFKELNKRSTFYNNNVLSYK